MPKKLKQLAVKNGQNSHSKGAQNWAQDLNQLRELIGGKFLAERSQQLVVPMVKNAVKYG